MWCDTCVLGGYSGRGGGQSGKVRKSQERQRGSASCPPNAAGCPPSAASCPRSSASCPRNSAVRRHSGQPAPGHGRCLGSLSPQSPPPTLPALLGNLLDANNQTKATLTNQCGEHMGGPGEGEEDGCASTSCGLLELKRAPPLRPNARSANHPRDWPDTLAYVGLPPTYKHVPTHIESLSRTQTHPTTRVARSLSHSEFKYHNYRTTGTIIVGAVVTTRA